MKEYTYYFADGTKNTIEIEEKWYDLLKEMDEVERKQKYNYERHNYLLSQDCQRTLFEKVFVERKKITEIAKEEGVCHQAISQRVERIKAKLKKLLA